MTSVKLHSHIGRDGLLKLEIPIGLAETDVEIMLVFQPVKSVEIPILTSPQTPEELGWPPDFFERVVGGWQGELIREPQGDYEVREALE